MNSMIYSRLRWSCRRGMLELDVLLGNFLEEVYESLSATDQQLFVQLLDCTDPELFAWLTGKTEVNNQNFVEIVNKIRDHAQNRH